MIQSKDESPEIPEQRCWFCFYLMDRAGDAYEKGASPKPGDVSLCINCGAPGFFDETLQIIPPDENQLADLMVNEDVVKGIFAINGVQSAKGHKDQSIMWSPQRGLARSRQ